MDYVVFGIGFGATILVLGLLLRDFGPRLRFRTPKDGDDILSAEQLVARVSWSRFCAALGSVFALAGATFLLITIVSMILVLSDDTGLWVMASAFGLLLVVMAGWTWAFFHRFGSFGILPERAEKETLAPAASQRQPAPPREVAFIGPRLESARDAATGAGEAMFVAGEETPDTTEAPPAESVTATEAAEEPTELAAIEVETGEEAPASAGVEPIVGPAVPEPMLEARLETPEERLAQAESPIDHGSAEGDLGLAASGPRRPGLRVSRAQVDADATDTAAQEPLGPPVPTDLDRA